MHFVPFTAIAIPFGRATDAPHDSLGGRYSWHWMPFEVGMGTKVLDQLYVGAYVNLGVGWEGSDRHTEARCEAGDDLDDDVSCSSVSVHGGVELRYTFAPSEPISGWVGYGIGVTSVSQTISDVGQYSETSTAQGIELARLSGGVDFRVKRGFGLGPYAVVSIGRFIHQRTEVRDTITFSGAIEDPAIHAWLCLGLRMVVFP
jgi:opacity protein-like surface antigen